MREVSLEELLEAGCHFGHQVSRQNAKARDYIFEARDGIHIIDLQKTKEGLEEAGQYIQSVAKSGGTLLVLGTKRQAEGILKEEINRVKKEHADGFYFATKRWIGGTLTNLSEVSKNFKKLKHITQRLQDENERVKYTKREINEWEKDRQKLETYYGGLAEMTKIPDAIFIIDTHLEHVAAREAQRVGVSTVGITDTNADPAIITYPIPANDDAVGSLKLIISYIFDAWLEGKKQQEKAEESAKAQESKSEKAQEEEKKNEKIKNKNETEKVKKKETEKKEPKKETVKKQNNSKFSIF